jgi:hypothetical protein
VDGGTVSAAVARRPYTLYLVSGIRNPASCIRYLVSGNLYLQRMKYSSIIGIVAALLIILACFLPWTFHPDLNKHFTGFYSEDNIYGKPGKLYAFFAAILIILFVIPRVWAKRTNWLVATLTVAYTIRTYFLFSTCYSGICPTKEVGIYLLIAAVAIVFVMAMVPDIKLKK